MDDEWTVHERLWTPYDWDQLFADPDDPPICCFCDKVLEDRRLAAFLPLQLSWSPLSGVDFRFAHVQCVRKAMHPNHPLYG